MKRNIRLTESDLHAIVGESVRKVLSEMDWKTYINAARKRKSQADELRDSFRHGRNSYDDKADELERHAQHMFGQKHGKDGYPYQWVGSPDYKGRYTRGQALDDSDFATKAPTTQGWWNGEKADGIRHYRRGEGFPSRNGGRIHDDEYNYAYGDDNGWSGDFNAHRTDKIDKDGIRMDADLSSNADYMSDYKDKDYMDALNRMGDDMARFYGGKSQYIQGKGWD